MCLCKGQENCLLSHCNLLPLLLSTGQAQLSVQSLCFCQQWMQQNGIEAGLPLALPGITIAGTSKHWCIALQTFSQSYLKVGGVAERQKQVASYQKIHWCISRAWQLVFMSAVTHYHFNATENKIPMEFWNFRSQKWESGVDFIPLDLGKTTNNLFLAGAKNSKKFSLAKFKLALRF